MVKAEDIVRLACDAGLTENGIAYACRSLADHHLKANAAGYGQFRRMAAGAMAELALRHHLLDRAVPFEVWGPPPFGDPNRFTVSLRGRRCELRTFLITDRRQAASIHANPELLLDVPALVPDSDYVEEGKSPEDVCLFAFLPADSPSVGHGTDPSIGMHRRSHLIYLMPSAWAHPRSWRPLGALAVKAERGDTLRLEIGGVDRDRKMLISSQNIVPGERLEVQGDFHSLTYAHAGARPEGRLGLRFSSRPGPVVINRDDWNDVWLEASDLYLVGWLSRDEFRNRAVRLHAGSRVFQYRSTKLDNLAVRVSELKPIQRLLELASHTPA